MGGNDYVEDISDGIVKNVETSDTIKVDTAPTDQVLQPIEQTRAVRTRKRRTRLPVITRQLR
jgi:hypothetical protein